MWDVVAHARQSGFKTAILTNGCLITEEDARKAASLGVADIQVSLEGPPNLHDGIRGEGSFAAATRGTRHLIAEGNVVSANMTLSRLNIDHLEETAGIAREIGFGGIGFSRLVPCGSGESLLKSLLSPEEIRAAYEKIPALNGPGFEVASGDPLAGIPAQAENPPTGDLVLAGCSAAFSGVTITSDGSVMPCRRIGIKIGNLRKTSLRQIWSASRNPLAAPPTGELQRKMRAMPVLALLPGLPRRGLRLFKNAGCPRPLCRRSPMLGGLQRMISPPLTPGSSALRERPPTATGRRACFP